MRVARDSVLRRIAGVSAGIVLGCAGAVAALVLLADAAARAERGSPAWEAGAQLINFGYGLFLLAGGLLGSWLGRRHLARPQLSPWRRRPRGTFLNHYPVAMLGGVIVGAASSFFTIPAARAVVDTLNLYAEMITPRMVRTTTLLMMAAVFLGMLSVARFTVHALDRDIYVRRRIRNALRAAGG
jgi:hypothetical protein